MELHGVVRVAAGEAGGVHRARVVAEAGVDAVEDPVPHHPDLAAEHLLRGAPEELEGAWYPRLLHRRLDCQGPSHPRGAVDVVAAAVAGGPRLDGLLVGDGLLGEPGEGVVLPHHADDGLPAPIGGDEGGGYPGDPPLDLEAVTLQLVREQLRRLELDEAQLGVPPDGVADLDEPLLVLLQPFDGCLLPVV